MPVPAPHTAEGGPAQCTAGKTEDPQHDQRGPIPTNPGGPSGTDAWPVWLGATVYTLTFNDAQLPHSFQGVRQVWRNFLGAMRRWRKDSFDYVYAIEGRHGDKRFHIHLVLRDADFTLEEVRFLWPGGFVDGEPLLQGPEDSFRRMARYLVKERHDGWVIPLGARTWVASRSLYGKLPAVEKWRAEDGNIPVPNQATWAEENCTRNPFGAYHYAAYITRYTYNNARVRARHRLEI